MMARPMLVHKETRSGFRVSHIRTKHESKGFKK